MVVCVSACVRTYVRVLIHMCVGGKGTTKKKGEKEVKVNLEKVPTMDLNLQPCACGPTVLSPSTTARCSLALIGGNRVSQSDFPSFLSHSALYLQPSESVSNLSHTLCRCVHQV